MPVALWGTTTFWSSSSDSSTRIEVIIFVVEAIGRRSSGCFEKTTVPVSESMRMAAAAVSSGGLLLSRRGRGGDGPGGELGDGVGRRGSRSSKQAESDRNRQRRQDEDSARRDYPGRRSAGPSPASPAGTYLPWQRRVGPSPHRTHGSG